MPRVTLLPLVCVRLIVLVLLPALPTVKLPPIVVLVLPTERLVLLIEVVAEPTVTAKGLFVSPRLTVLPGLLVTCTPLEPSLGFTDVSFIVVPPKAEPAPAASINARTILFRLKGLSILLFINIVNFSLNNDWEVLDIGRLAPKPLPGLGFNVLQTLHSQAASGRVKN